MRLPNLCGDAEKEPAKETEKKQPIRQVENEKNVGVLEGKGTQYFEEGVCIMINCVKGCRQDNY